MRWHSTIRVLLHPVAFAPRPLALVDHVMAEIVASPDAALGRREIADDIALALASKHALAALHEGDQPLSAIRRYLTALHERITAELEATDAAP
jgi:hypothetical protein